MLEMCRPLEMCQMCRPLEMCRPASLVLPEEANTPRCGGPAKEANQVPEPPQPFVAARIRSRDADRKFYNIAASVIKARSVERYCVKRRYSEFLEFDQKVRSKFLRLPKLPEKSFWRKTFVPSFMARRQKALNDYVIALTEADPKALDPLLRGFLGVPSATPAAMDKVEGLSL